MEYKARLMAYGIVQDLAPSIPAKIKSKAFKILEEHRVALEQTATVKDENSIPHFVETTQRLLS